MKLIQISVNDPRNLISDVDKANFISHFISNFCTSVADTDFVAVDQPCEDKPTLIEEIDEYGIQNWISLMYFGTDWRFLKSKTSCRFIWSGYDEQFFICLKFSDSLDNFIHPNLSVDECSKYLIETDFFDGF